MERIVQRLITAAVAGSIGFVAGFGFMMALIAVETDEEGCIQDENLHRVVDTLRHTILD